MFAAGTCIFNDDFATPELDRGKWFPHYLPHWSSLDRTKAQYKIQDSYLRLLIGPDQLLWSSEFDSTVKVSNLQTGHCSGPVGSSEGQHRFRDGLVVRDHVPARRLFLPHHCRLEMRARATLNSWNLAALWLIGFEDRPEHSGEITVFEVFGDKVDADGVRIGRGIKKIHDPALETEFDDGKLPLKLHEWHDYSMIWGPAGVAFLVDGKVVTTTRQSPDYPMQLMLNLYDLPGSHDRTHAITEAFDIDHIRAWAHAV